MILAFLGEGHARLFHVVRSMDVCLVLDEQLRHLFTSKCAGKHERRAPKLISLLNIGAKLDQASHAREFIVLDRQ